MRVLRFLFSAFLILAVATILVGFVAREVLLFAGTSMIKSSLSTLHKVSRDNLQFARQCREKGALAQDVATIGGLQMRFLSGNRYVLEVICTQFRSDPIAIETYTLPPFVKKSPGSSGIVWGNERSGIEIEVFGRRQGILVEDEEVKTFASGSRTLGRSPQSTCEGFGYLCCQSEVEVGAGQPNTTVTDCPKDCYATCTARPVVLSLNTDPFPNETTRVTSALSGTPVTFTFVTSYESAEPVTVILDFGDGQRETFQTANGKATHEYVCASSICEYRASVRAVAASGVESLLTPIAQLTIRVE